MSSGLPVVASDLPVHREICSEAGIYFPRFSPEALAERVLEIQGSPELSERLSRAGLLRSRDFSWSEHVARLVAMAEELIAIKPRRN
jgi:glycosyltransferase involved in cell wall biosynthesis